MSDSSTRLHSLDSLRGLAAIYVVFFHLLLVPTPNPVIPSLFLSKAVLFGGTGVFLFFVISGFSLSMTMPRHDRSGHPMLSYGLSRVFRIVPLFLFMIVVSSFRDRYYFDHFPSVPKLIVNLSLLFNLVPGQQEGIVWASWTIGVEVLFYAMFLPLFRMSILKQLLLGLSSVILFLSIDRYATGYFYWSVLGYFFIFVVGMLAFECFSVLRNRSNSSFVGNMLIVFSLMILLTCMTFDGAQNNIYLRNIIGIGYAVLLVGCMLRSPLILSLKTLTFFGRISYSLYLVHAPIIYACSWLFSQITMTLPIPVSYPACAVVAFAIAVPCAYLCHIAVEQPAIQLGRRVLREVTQAISPISPSQI